MITFIVRRLVAAFFIVLAASFIVYMLMANAGDPLAFTVEITEPDRSARRSIDSVTDALNLDVNPVARYFLWLGDVLQGDFGISARTQQPVIDDLGEPGAADAQAGRRRRHPVDPHRHVRRHRHGAQAVLRLRLHHDVLHVRVLLAARSSGSPSSSRASGGINFNDWLRDGAHFAPWFIVLGGLAAAGLAYSVAGGRTPHDGWRSPPSAAGCSRRVLIYISATQWLLDPGFGPVVLAIFAAAIAYGVTAVMAGVRNRKALYSALTTAGIGVVAVVPAAGGLRQRRHEPLVAARARRRGDPRRGRRRLRLRWLRQGPVGADRRRHRAARLGADLRRPHDAVVGRVLGQPGHPQPPDQDDRRP